jgi:hypothetical protein
LASFSRLSLSPVPWHSTSSLRFFFSRKENNA